MQIEVMIFGQLTDITNNSMLTFTNISDTDGLLTELNRLHPELAGYKYIVAVDKKAIKTNTVLKEGNTVALLPPFSGG